MEFYTVYKEPRPVRLCEATRQFAYDSLENHAYGLEAMKTASVSMDHIEGFAAMTPLEKERLICARSRKNAPSAWCRESGSAARLPWVWPFIT